MSYLVYYTHPSKWGKRKWGKGVIYVVELNPAEVMRYRVRYDRLPEGIANRKAKLVLRYWIVGKWYKKRELRELREQAQQFINALKAGVKHIPDWERQESKR